MTENKFPGYQPPKYPLKEYASSVEDMDFLFDNSGCTSIVYAFGWKDEDEERKMFDKAGKLGVHLERRKLQTFTVQNQGELFNKINEKGMSKDIFLFTLNFDLRDHQDEDKLANGYKLWATSNIFFSGMRTVSE